MALRPLVQRLYHVHRVGVARFQMQPKQLQESTDISRRNTLNSNNLYYACAPRQCLHTSAAMSKKKKGDALVFTSDADLEVHVYGQDDEDLGLMTKHQADMLAQEGGLHVVVLPDQDKPHPVLKLMTGKDLRAAQMHDHQERRTHRKHKTHEIKLSTKIMDHDLDTKLHRAVKWLQKGDHVNMHIQFGADHEKKAAQVHRHIAEIVKSTAVMKHTKTQSELRLSLEPLTSEAEKTEHDTKSNSKRANQKKQGQ